MKHKANLILLFLLFTSYSFSQNLKGESRILTFNSQLRELTDKKQPELNSTPIPSDSKFTIVDEIGDDFKIYFWNWKDEDKYKLFNIDSTTNQQKYFLIPKKEIEVYSQKIYKRCSPVIGTLALPFKYRPQDGTFESTFALSMTGGVKLNPWWKNEHTFALVLGVGPSTVKITNNNINSGEILENEFTTASVTLSASLVYQWDSLQIGISSGFDNLIDNNEYNWNYQGKPWLSIGIGISLFSPSEPAKPKSN